MKWWMFGSWAAVVACGTPYDDPTEETDVDLDPGDTAKLDMGPPPPQPPPTGHAGPYADVVVAEPPPPPVSGGTLIRSADGSRLFAADPDRDAVYVVDPDALELLHRIDLSPRSEPGRLAEGPDGLLHVALRGAGAVATIDPTTGELVQARSACARPRGLAVDSDGDILVACDEGVVARLGADGSHQAAEVGLPLRDVVSVGPWVRVSTFREPSVVTLDRYGAVVDARAPNKIGVDGTGFSDTPPTVDAPDGELVLDVMIPNTARRTIGTADGGWWMLHQAASQATVTSGPTYGGDGCIPAQTSVLTRATADDETVQSWPLHHYAPVFDFAVTDDETLAAVVGAGQRAWGIAFLPLEGSFDALPLPCAAPATTYGEPTSVVFDGDRRAWVQTREPASLVRIDPKDAAAVRIVALHDRSVKDSGHDLFHRPTEGLIACVSCHPEGRDDGQRWGLSEVEMHRTQALNVRLEDSEPLHWRGEMSDMLEIVDEIRGERMLGEVLTTQHAEALQRWVFALAPEPVPYPADPPAVVRGRAVFEALGCASCHAGERLTTDETMMMGEYGLLQVPTLLRVSLRPPYMHDGRAASLDDAVDEMLPFSSPTADPTPADRADLLVYLAAL